MYHSGSLFMLEHIRLIDNSTLTVYLSVFGISHTSLPLKKLIGIIYEVLYNFKLAEKCFCGY